MTPEETINIIRERLMDCEDYRLQFGSYPDGYDCEFVQAILAAAQALKEIQNYKKIGTLEELARAKKYIDLAKKHGTIGEMIDSCAEYEEIGTAEECRKAVEKQKPKKPRLNYKPKFFGKAIDWSENLEEK